MLYLYLEEGVYRIYQYKWDVYNYMDASFICEFDKKDISKIKQEYQIKD